MTDTVCCGLCSGEMSEAELDEVKGGGCHQACLDKEQDDE